MLCQGWFWVALFALLVTAHVDWMKGLFALGLAIDISRWFWAILKEACRPIRQRAEVREREHESRRSRAEQDRREEVARAHKLQLEREATKRYEIFAQDQRHEIARIRSEKANRIPNAAERVRAVKALVDQLDISEEEKQALRDVIDRKLFLLLKGAIDDAV